MIMVGILTLGMACTDNQGQAVVDISSDYDSAVVETLIKYKDYETLAIGEQHWNVEQHEFLKAFDNASGFYGSRAPYRC
jgi:hypothetical protein